MRIHRKETQSDKTEKKGQEPSKKDSDAFDSLLTTKKGATGARTAAASSFKTLHRPKTRGAKGKKKGGGKEKATEEAFDQALSTESAKTKGQGKGKISRGPLKRKGGEDSPTKESESGSTGTDEKSLKAGEEKEERKIPEMSPAETRSLASAYGPGGIIKGNTETLQKAEAAERASTAKLQMIADKVLTGLQIHQAKNRTEAHMQLNLGQLGDAKVQMHRDDAGKLHLSFDSLSESAQLVLQDRVHELSKSLQQKGVNVAEIKVAGTEIRAETTPQSGSDTDSQRDSQSRDGEERSRGQYLEKEELGDPE